MRTYHQMGLVPVNKYTIYMQGYAPSISLKEAIERYKRKHGKRPVKAVVPADYDMSLAKGARIAVEPSKNVQLVLLSDQYVIWANGPADGILIRNVESNDIGNEDT